MTLRGAKIHREAFYVYFVISTKKKMHRHVKPVNAIFLKKLFELLTFYIQSGFLNVYIYITFITYAVTI